MRIPLALAACLLLLSSSHVSADDALPTTQPAYKAMPWHLIDTWWNLGHDVEFESYSVDVEISDDVPADVNLYIAPIGIATLGEQKCYGGIQTRSDGHTRTDPKVRPIGPGLLFSAWGERSLDAIRPADGGFCQSSGHEGDFISVRRPYKWTKGHYTYSLVRMDSQTVDGVAYTWVGAFLQSRERDENVFIGALRFKGEKLRFGKSVANFIEIYGARKPVEEIPKLTVTFATPKVNGKSIEGATAKAVYPAGVPDYADAAAKDGRIVITVGSPGAPRTKRSVELIGE